MLIEGWMEAGGPRAGLPDAVLGGELDLRSWLTGSYGESAEAAGAELMASRGLAEEPWRR